LFRNRQNEFKEFFCEENDLVFCNGVYSVIDSAGHQQATPTEWRLFIGSSNVSLKTVFLHNGNEFHSLRQAHAANMK